MNTRRLTLALNDLRGRLGEQPRPVDLRDAEECITVLCRLLNGKPIERAFGAPGDWGYGTPIGDALAAAPEPPPPPRFDERECGGVFDGTSVISDADPGL